MNIPYVMKKCSCCGEWLVANTVNFIKRSGNKYGLSGICRLCQNRNETQWNEKIKNKAIKKSCQQQEQSQQQDKKSGSCKKIKDQDYKQNIEYYRLKKKQEREQRIKHKAKKEKEKELQSLKNYLEYLNKGAGERVNTQNLMNCITMEQLLDMMDFFNWECAYSGIKMTRDTRSVDHIAPISKGGEHAIWNCVPMYRKYNSRKHKKDIIEWYRKQDFYSEDRLEKIYEWQEYAFNKWGKDTEYFNSNDI